MWQKFLDECDWLVHGFMYVGIAVGAIGLAFLYLAWVVTSIVPAAILP